MNSTPDQPAPGPGPEDERPAVPPVPPVPPMPPLPPAPAQGAQAAPGYGQQPYAQQPAPPAYAQQPYAQQPPPPGWAPTPAPAPRLWGWSFGAWVAVGIALGIVLPVALFFVANAIDAALNDYSSGIALGYALIAMVVVAVAGIVCMFFARTRGLGTGLLISVAATPIIVFGVCVAVLTAGG
ncbi:hypothetical protein [Microbacterium phosphatis]|uniref:hypothetical protein n=2 Tax=Microbacterium phosphatis TaxID=3140248 RepID=UPI00313FE18A